jgi:molybdenum cofactor biosynthesis protein B
MGDASHLDRRVAHVSCAIVTVSDTRTERTDESGLLIRTLLERHEHPIHSSALLRDEPDVVRSHVRSLCDDAACAAVLISGGTGLAARDATFEAISGLFEKTLDGFGELFRALSFPEVGAAAMLSRATAGVCQATVVFSMPGSPSAVRLAMEKLILPQLGHVVALIRR